MGEVKVGNFATFRTQLPELSLDFLTGLVNDCVEVFVELVCGNERDLEFGESRIVVFFRDWNPVALSVEIVIGPGCLTGVEREMRLCLRSSAFSELVRQA